MSALGDDARKTTTAVLLSLVLHAGLLVALSIVGVLPAPKNLLEPFPLYLGPVGPAGGVGGAHGFGAPTEAGGRAAPAAESEPEPPEPEDVVVPVLPPPKPAPKPPEVAKNPRPTKKSVPLKSDAPPANVASTGEAPGTGEGSGVAAGVRGGPGGGGGGAGGTAAYEQVLAAWLDRHKYYPSTLRRRGIEGEGKLGIRITREGKIVHVEVLKTFSHPSLEPIAQDWVRRSEPFPPMPSSLPGDTYSFAVPVVFRLE